MDLEHSTLQGIFWQMLKKGWVEPNFNDIEWRLTDYKILTLTYFRSSSTYFSLSLSVSQWDVIQTTKPCREAALRRFSGRLLKKYRGKSIATKNDTTFMHATGTFQFEIGPCWISFQFYPTPVSDIFFRSCKECHYPACIPESSWRSLERPLAFGKEISQDSRWMNLCNY